MMSQIRDRSNPIEPLAIASDGRDSYPEAMYERHYHFLVVGEGY